VSRQATHYAPAAGHRPRQASRKGQVTATGHRDRPPRQATPGGWPAGQWPAVWGYGLPCAAGHRAVGGA